MIARSVCPLDCPDRCGLDVTVEDGRIASIDASPVNPVTGGFICAKVRGFAKRVYGPDRLRHPMRRTGAKGAGAFERISWDAALDLVAERLDDARKRFGGESILPFAYGGSNGMLSQGTADERLFRLLGASRLARTVCAAQTTAAADAMYGRMASTDFPDFEHAAFILIWGANPKHSNIHLMPYLKAARGRGARIALVDPRRAMGEAWVDHHLAVRPGSDAAVALAMIAHIERIGAVDRAFIAAHTTGWERLAARAREWTLERAASRAGVAPGAIAALAEAYAQADPALLRCGWGLERNINGEASVAAVLALPAVAGKFGKRGSGYALSSSEVYRVSADRLAGVPEPAARTINMSRLGRVLLEQDGPPVKALFVYDANPVVTLPDQNRVALGLMRDDLFTVVFDQVLTDTARFADVVLPATTFLEQRELSTSYGTYTVMLSEPAIAPVDEARPNAEVFRLLAQRLGLDPGPEGDALVRQALGAVEGRLAGDGSDRLERLRREGWLRPEAGGAIQFGGVFPQTEDAKAHLWPDALGDDPYLVLEDPATPQHPLALISPATEKTICSTLGEVAFDVAWLEMHPEDAAARGLGDGDVVRVFNDLGEVQVGLRLSAALRPGVVFLPKGIWNRHTRNGRVGSALVSDAVSPLSGGACFNDARVQVSRA